MTAVTTRLLRMGTLSLTPRGLDEPDLYGHVVRTGWGRVDWTVTTGWIGTTVATGRTLTRGGAWVAAVAAAHRGGVTR